MYPKLVVLIFSTVSILSSLLVMEILLLIVFYILFINFLQDNVLKTFNFIVKTSHKIVVCILIVIKNVSLDWP